VAHLAHPEHRLVFHLTAWHGVVATLARLRSVPPKPRHLTVGAVSKTRCISSAMLWTGGTRMRMVNSNGSQKSSPVLHESNQPMDSPSVVFEMVHDCTINFSHVCNNLHNAFIRP